MRTVDASGPRRVTVRTGFTRCRPSWISRRGDDVCGFAVEGIYVLRRLGVRRNEGGVTARAQSIVVLARGTGAVEQDRQG